MKKIIIWLTVFLITFFIMSCEDKPNDVDRTAKAKFIVIDTSGTLDIDQKTNLRLFKNGTVTFFSRDYGESFKFKTDENGILYADGLLASHYTISVNHQISEAFSVFGSKEKDIYGSQNEVDTIYLRGMPSSAVIINEIYAAGPVNNVYYMFDLFIELYNNSDEVQYLDGNIICRCTKKDNEPSGIITASDGNTYVRVIYAFQFPGTPGGKQYPIQPYEFVVVAGDAVDHRQAVSTSIDLSNAQWEFYNKQSTDIDVPNVPNVENILSKTTTDFLIGLTNDAVIISSGKKGVRMEGTDAMIDLSTVLDGVQYMSNPIFTRKLDGRVDAGTAGIGIPSYSGKSMERVVLDKSNPKKHSDTNNSTVDFGVNDKPTPGYQGNPIQ
jgi:hypothetical protein